MCLCFEQYACRLLRGWKIEGTHTHTTKIEQHTHVIPLARFILFEIVSLCTLACSCVWAMTKRDSIPGERFSTKLEARSAVCYLALLKMLEKGYIDERLDPSPKSDRLAVSGPIQSIPIKKEEQVLPQVLSSFIRSFVHSFNINPFVHSFTSFICFNKSLLHAPRSPRLNIAQGVILPSVAL